ncbi:OmpA family protein [Rheinheimera sp. UJ51]|uniref:OmpA family protein n=1 Tax=unclassified Rheinheimera TaxID=115860 RepID=UPI001E340BD6|nr:MULTISPECIES: OmpA family protein [unclassified Rheinheimera]MCC5450443.1 OmpA family protein [Rheinheimera sp. UJ51]MCF4009120.1 OmpA family protein [Rheinheimera sp. UJ63]
MYRHRGSQQQTEREDLDRWLVSYADYMTLMFALFVVLYALSLVKNEEFSVLTDSITKVFDKTAKNQTAATGETLLPLSNKQSDFPLYGTSLEPAQGPELVADSATLSDVRQRFLGSALQSIEQELTQALSNLIEQGVAKLRQDEDWLVIELNSGLLFASGSATATESARTLLKEIGKIINPINNFLRVRGYTDNIPIRNEVFSSNWELSVARATSVLRLLEDSGTPSHRMAIEGFGQYYPSADNSTASGRAENRKVVIAISRYGYRPEQPSPEADAALEQQLRQVTQEDGSIQVIALPGGGIRITTRQENPDAVPQGQDPE